MLLFGDLGIQLRDSHARQELCLWAASPPQSTPYGLWLASYHATVVGGLTCHSFSCLEAVSRFCAICHHRSIGHSCFSSSFLWRRDRSKESYGISDISSHPTIMPLIKHQFAFAVSTGSNVYFPAALPVVGQHFFCVCVCVISDVKQCISYCCCCCCCPLLVGGQHWREVQKFGLFLWAVCVFWFVHSVWDSQG